MATRTTRESGLKEVEQFEAAVFFDGMCSTKVVSKLEEMS